MSSSRAARSRRTETADRARSHARSVKAAAGLAPSVMAVGWIDSIDASGGALVDFPGNIAGPVPAKSVVRLHPEQWSQALLRESRIPVLLGFEGVDVGRPIVLGVVHETIREPSSPSVREASVRVDGRRVELVGDEEIVIRCGHASITLRADGHVVVKGNELVSRAAGTNRIKGSSVSIN